MAIMPPFTRKNVGSAQASMSPSESESESSSESESASPSGESESASDIDAPQMVGGAENPLKKWAQARSK